MKGIFLFLMMLLAGMSVPTANDLSFLAEVDASVLLEAASPGGTPLLLELSLKDSNGYVQRAEFDFGSNGVIDLSVNPHDLEEDQPLYRGIPFRSFGRLHTMDIYLHTEAGILRRSIETAFADYQWGRDNLSFANDNRFRDTAGAVSTYLLDWAESRFGTLSDEETYLLVSLMYRLFRGNIGRCYGFSSLGLYYQDYPGSISGNYASAYELDERDPEVLSLIHILQNDIVYHIFSTREVSPELDHEPEDLSFQREEIIASLQEGRPVVLGYLSSRTHHSMVVYGYINLVDQDRILLTAGNNWNRNQQDNMSSDDAVLLPLYRQDGSYRLDWLSYTYRPEDRVFVLHPTRQYHPSRETLAALLEQERVQIIEDNKHRIIVEHFEWAYLEDDKGSKRGYDGTRGWWGFPGVEYRRFDDIFIFNVPADLEAWLAIGPANWNDRLERPKNAHVSAALFEEGVLDVFVLRDILHGEEEKKILPLNSPLGFK